jgi:hypothetical protein
MVSPPELVRLLIAEIDRNIPAAYTDLTQARACWARSPTAAQGHACATAEAYLDELIDLRGAVGRRVTGPVLGRSAHRVAAGRSRPVARLARAASAQG